MGKDQTWSYSRIKTFYDCPYRWYLRYIAEEERNDTFFASYGRFVHKLIEQYCKGEKTKDQLCDTYLLEFRNQVSSDIPNKIVFDNYFKSGLNGIQSIQPFPCEVIAIEKRVNFDLDGIHFVGYIDFLGKQNDDFIIIDNKSRMLKPRTNRRKPVKSDRELDEYLKQLYLYSAAIEQEYGKLPTKLCLNCFRVPVLIEDEFREKAYKEAKEWAIQSVEEISNETEFKPDASYFKCKYLCEMRDKCEYYAMSKG